MIENLNEKIRQIRELKNLSQEYMAQELGLSTRAYSKIESGETQLTINRLNEISKILAVTPQEILGFDATIIFNNGNNQQGGKYENTIYHQTEVKLLKELYEKLLLEKDKRISVLELMLNRK
ncbi:MAG: helix-turn-helix transcriptional regulator [Bacteroidia bacterium]|nr:helix-turn-helix transcriptional regulator [Bacteroidia bacterium]